MVKPSGCLLIIVLVFVFGNALWHSDLIYLSASRCLSIFLDLMDLLIYLVFGW